MNLYIDLSDFIAIIGLWMSLMGAAWFVGRWMGQREGVEKYDHSEKALMQRVLDTNRFDGTGSSSDYQPSASSTTKESNR